MPCIKLTTCHEIYMAEMSITTTNESQKILLWTDFTSYFTSNELALHCLETLSYTLDGKQLTLSNTEVDLGVVLNSNLTWVNQVNSVRYKANKMLGFIRRSTKEIHDVRVRKSLYLQLVRNNFAYASQVWSPQTIQLIENIEKVQRRATKYILNLGFTTNVPYTTRLLQLGLLPLSYWHEYLDLVLLYKIINGYTYIDDNARPTMAGSGITRSQTRIRT